MSKIQQRLFSTRRFIQSLDGVESFIVPGRQCIWIVSKACTVHRVLDFEHIPKSKRDAALRQQILLLSPFKEPGFWVDWQSGAACIWLWDQARQNELLRPLLSDSENNLKKSNIEFVPESALTLKIQKGGIICQISENYIGQYWQDGKLQAETAWRSMPDLDQWHQFLNLHTQDLEGLPEVKVIELSKATPWRSFQLGQLISSNSERTIMSGIAIVVAMILTFQLTGLVRLTVNNAIISSSIEELGPELKESLALRDEYFNLRSQNQKYAALAGPSQLEMMSDIAGVLATFNVHILRWDFHDNKIELLVADANPDLNSYVEQLESFGWMTAIRIDRVSNGREASIYAELVEDL